MQLLRSPPWHIAFERDPEREGRVLYNFDPKNPAVLPTPDNQEEREQEHEKKKKNVDAGRSATRGKVGETMHDDGEHGEHGEHAGAKEVVAHIDEFTEELGHIEKMMQENEARAQKELPAEDRIVWEEVKKTLRMHKKDLGRMRATAQKIAEWESGSINPHELARWMPDSGFIGGDDDLDLSDAISQAILHGKQNAEQQRILNGGDQWETHNPTSRLQAVNAIGRVEVAGAAGLTVGAVLQQILQNIHGSVEVYKKRIEQSNIEKVAHQFHEQAHEEEHEHQDHDHGGGHGHPGVFGPIMDVYDKTKRTLGIEFYTIGEIWDAIKKVKDAYLHAYQERKDLKSDILATDLGKLAKILPFGGEHVDLALQSQLDSKNEKHANEYVEGLKSRDATFSNLFGPGGEFERAHHEPNRARAVMQYAAERGWLYDIDKSLSTEEKKIFGVSLSELCRDWDGPKVANYYTRLRGINSKGRNDEIEKNKARVEDFDSTQLFIDEMNREFKKQNLWAIVGIVKRAIERGLSAEVSPWLSVTIMRFIAEHPEVRKHANRIFLDLIGKLGLYRAGGFTIGHYKYDRAALEKWLPSGKGMEEAGVLGKAIATIRQDIKDATGRNFSTEQEILELDRIIARVLNGGVLNESSTINGKPVGIRPGKTITIFNGKYEFYRNSSVINGQSTLDPGIKAEDPDYYAPYNYKYETGQETFLVGHQPYMQIYAATGNGQLDHPDKAPGHASNILRHYRALRDAGLNAEAEAIRQEAGEKLQQVYTIRFCGDTRTAAVPDYVTFQENGSPSREFVILTFLKEGFLDITAAVKTVMDNDSSTGVGFSSKLLKQVAAAAGIGSSLTERTSTRRPTDTAELITQEWQAAIGTLRAMKPAQWAAALENVHKLVGSTVKQTAIKKAEKEQ